MIRFDICATAGERAGSRIGHLKVELNPDYELAVRIRRVSPVQSRQGSSSPSLAPSFVREADDSDSVDVRFASSSSESVRSFPSMGPTSASEVAVSPNRDETPHLGELDVVSQASHTPPLQASESAASDPDDGVDERGALTPSVELASIDIEAYEKFCEAPLSLVELRSKISELDDLQRRLQMLGQADGDGDSAREHEELAATPRIIAPPSTPSGRFDFDHEAVRLVSASPIFTRAPVLRDDDDKPSEIKITPISASNTLPDVESEELAPSKDSVEVDIDVTSSVDVGIQSDDALSNVEAGVPSTLTETTDASCQVALSREMEVSEESGAVDAADAPEVSGPSTQLQESNVVVEEPIGDEPNDDCETISSADGDGDGDNALTAASKCGDGVDTAALTTSSPLPSSTSRSRETSPSLPPRPSRAIATNRDPLGLPPRPPLRRPSPEPLARPVWQSSLQISDVERRRLERIARIRKGEF